MTTVVGVLCTRVRVEEKRLIAALAEAGVVAKPVPPSLLPIPVGSPPQPGDPAVPADARPAIVIDRVVSRAHARASRVTYRFANIPVIDGGRSSRSDRLVIAERLAEIGLPRPRTVLVSSETAGLAAVRQVGGPCTLMPNDPGTPEIALHDLDVAEATLEHRDMLGGHHDNISLIQDGIAASGSRLRLILVDGRVIAREGRVDGDWDLTTASRLAELTAAVLRSDFVGVDIAMMGGKLVIWDTIPTPDFRHAEPIGDLTVEGAVAELVRRRLGLPEIAKADGPPAQANGRAADVDATTLVAGHRLEGAQDAVLTA